MALADTTLVPMEAERLASTLTFASKNDALTFDIAGRDYVTLQFDSASAWPAGAVITVQTALAPSRFSGRLCTPPWASSRSRSSSAPPWR